MTILFPMPVVEIDDGPLGGFLFGTQEKGDLRNYMKFAVTVDGKPVTPRLRDIRYRPITGDGPDFGDFYSGPEATQRNCVDDAFRNALKRRRAAGKLGDRLILGYVLKTAQYWSGSIGRFRLVVDKGKTENIVAFCPLNAKKISDTRFEWSATNFTPERDIEVVFFTARGAEQ